MSALFSPITLSGLTLENRIVVSPMCQYSADDGSANDWHLAHLGTLSAGGAGLLVVEATAVSREGRITHGDLGLYGDANEKALERVVAAVAQPRGGCSALPPGDTPHAQRCTRYVSRTRGAPGAEAPRTHNTSHLKRAGILATSRPLPDHATARGGGPGGAW